MKTEELAEIVTKSKQGDEDAFNKLYQIYVKKVYYVCLRFLKDKEDALDVTQDTFVTAFEKLSTLQNPESFGMWINQIATNKCKNILIKKSRTFVEELKMDNQGIEDEDLNTEFIPEEYVLNKEKRKVIMEIIDNKLSDVQRMVILLYYYEGESVSEIAKILECSEGTVKSRLNSARKVIKKAIEDKEKKGFPILGIVAYFALSSIVEAEASEIILPPELMVTGSKFIAKNKVINSGNVKMAKKGIMFKVAGIGVGVLAVAGIAIAVAISGGDDKSENKPDREVAVTSDENLNENLDSEGYLNSETEEVETKKWKYFDGDKLDITKFDIDGWDRKIYIDGNVYEFPLTVDDISNIVDEKYNVYESGGFIDATGNLVSSLRSVRVELDDVISCDPSFPDSSENLHIHTEEDEYIDGIDIEIIFPENDRFGNSKTHDLRFGDFAYQYDDNLAILDRIKLTENGKNLRDMSYLDIIEEFGQPSMFIDGLYLGYQYEDCGVFFSFKYSEEQEEYMCVEVDLGRVDSDIYDACSVEYWSNLYTANEFATEE